MRNRPSLVTMCFLLAGAAGATLQGSSLARLEGDWRLVEQFYGDGESNLASVDIPVHLGIHPEGGGLTARVGAGEKRGGGLPWPAFVADSGPLPVQILSHKVDPSGGTIEAQYRVQPSPEDDLFLEIHEVYRLAEEGRVLAGSMTVTFRVGEATRGSFVLRRRFERVP